MESTGLKPRPRSLLTLILAISLTACSSDSSDSSSETPPPESPPPSDPPPEADVPPLSATVVSLDDGHMVGAEHWSEGDTSTGGQGQPVGELECLESIPSGFHEHAHLSVFLNGEALAVPNHVGIVALSPTEECQYQLHTHNATGMLHMHAETPTSFTLGQFFAIWGEPLERDNVAGLMDMPVVVYITDDGADSASVYEGELGAIELISHREITFQIGTEITEIPQFTWTGP